MCVCVSACVCVCAQASVTTAARLESAASFTLSKSTMIPCTANEKEMLSTIGCTLLHLSLSLYLSHCSLILFISYSPFPLSFSLSLSLFYFSLFYFLCRSRPLTLSLLHTNINKYRHAYRQIVFIIRSHNYFHTAYAYQSRTKVCIPCVTSVLSWLCSTKNTHTHTRTHTDLHVIVAS